MSWPSSIATTPDMFIIIARVVSDYITPVRLVVRIMTNNFKIFLDWSVNIEIAIPRVAHMTRNKFHVFDTVHPRWD